MPHAYRDSFLTYMLETVGFEPGTKLEPLAEPDDGSRIWESTVGHGTTSVMKRGIH